LRSAAGKLPTVHGAVKVEWSFSDDDLLTLVVEAPAQLNGVVHLPQPLLIAVNETSFMVNGSELDAPFTPNAGRLVVQQRRRAV
jgi:hypothetical protein